jgi:deoxyadenosine/deoxycytidine kinase
MASSMDTREFLADDLVLLVLTGLPGSGKTTLLKGLAEGVRTFINKRIPAGGIRVPLPRIPFVNEPSDMWQEWTVPDAGLEDTTVSMLKSYYSDRKKFAFAFRSFVHSTRFDALRDARQRAVSARSPVVVSDRCEKCDLIFAENDRENGNMNDAEWLALDWVTRLQPHMWRRRVYVHLRTSPEIAKERIDKREQDRCSDIGLVKLELLQELATKHDEVFRRDASSIDPFMTSVIVELDGNLDIEERGKDLDAWLEPVYRAVFEAIYYDMGKIQLQGTKLSHIVA